MAVVLTSFRPTLQVAGFTFIDLTTLLALGAQYSGAGNRWSTWRRMNTTGTSGYQTTNGKTLTVRAGRTAVQSTAIYPHSFMYGDTDVGSNSGSAPTNPKYQVGDSSFGVITTVATGWYEFVCFDFAAPSQKYGGFYNAGGANAAHHIVYGYEA